MNFVLRNTFVFVKKMLFQHLVKDTFKCNREDVPEEFVIFIKEDYALVK